MAGLQYCQTAQTACESEDKQAVSSTPGGPDGDARSSPVGAALLGAARKRAGLPGRPGTAGKGRAGRGKRCLTHGRDGKHICTVRTHSWISKLTAEAKKRDEILPTLKPPVYRTSRLHAILKCVCLPEIWGQGQPGTKEYFRGDCFLLTHNYIMQN